MRCIIGLTLFLVLYFGSCKLLGEISAAMAAADGHSPSSSQVLAAKTLTKYHALVAVGSGAAALLVCSVPWLLAKMSGPKEWENVERLTHHR